MTPAYRTPRIGSAVRSDREANPSPIEIGRGFTLIELLVVVGIVAILALLAVPTYQGKIARDQVVETAPLVELAKKPIAAAWAVGQTFPPDNAAAGLPAADKMVSNLVTSVLVEGGAVHVTFGNHASGVLRGKVLTFRPGIVEDAPIVPVAWVCGYASPPDKMTAKGQNRTDVDETYLPWNCRAK
jgi:type IV pilus assembly protein PilA